MENEFGLKLMYDGINYKFINFEQDYKPGQLIDAYMNLDLLKIKNIVCGCSYYKKSYDESLVDLAYTEIRDVLCKEFGPIGDLLVEVMRYHALNYDRNHMFYTVHQDPMVYSLVFNDTSYVKPGRMSMAQLLLTGLYIMGVVHRYNTELVIPDFYADEKDDLWYDYLNLKSQNITCKIVFENDALQEIIHIHNETSLMYFEYANEKERGDSV